MPAGRWPATSSRSARKSNSPRSAESLRPACLQLTAGFRVFDLLAGHLNPPLGPGWSVIWRPSSPAVPRNRTLTVAASTAVTFAEKRANFLPLRTAISWQAAGAYGYALRKSAFH